MPIFKRMIYRQKLHILYHLFSISSGLVDIIIYDIWNSQSIHSVSKQRDKKLHQINTRHISKYNNNNNNF